MNEEERAELYRQQLASRYQARCERFVGLAGNRAAREALDLAWAPPVMARIEAQSGIDPLLDCPECLPCEVPDKDIYISQLPESLLV